MKTKKQCCNCMAWNMIADQSRGTCRRRAPRIGDKGNGQWPITCADNGCEEFKARPNAERENITE